MHESSAKPGVIWQKAADTSDHLEPGRALYVAHSNEKVADRRPERRFRDMPNGQHTHVAQDRVRPLQERPRELADGGVKRGSAQARPRRGNTDFARDKMHTIHGNSNSFISGSLQQGAQKFPLREL
jgi:hypothetical protein